VHVLVQLEYTWHAENQVHAAKQSLRRSWCSGFSLRLQLQIEKRRRTGHGELEKVQATNLAVQDWRSPTDGPSSVGRMTLRLPSTALRARMLPEMP
jgi:hypothetical protein